ncbi:MAG: alpha/beta fold hydrolase [Muribaculaceae bacterium]|nr:alpha/beta fold hydrolase [Muribaculaceae bacterium]
MHRFIIGVAAAVAMSASAGDFTEKDVRVFNKDAGITLAGTVTAPADGSQRAAIVMATGSGPQDRDETVFGHRPFKAIAEYLSANGYVVLRMDDRGVGESEGERQEATTEDFAGDIAAGLAWVDSCYSGLPKGVIGHSEGGIIALKSAPQSDFIITLAGPAWSGDSIVMSQSQAAAVGMTGRWDGEAIQRKIMQTLKSPMADFQARIAVTSLINQAYGGMASMAGVREQIDTQVAAMVSPWYRAFLRYDPAEDARSVHVPWLALNGAKDTQVLPANLQTFMELNPAVTAVELPDLNHLFQTCTTGLPNEYAVLPEDISPTALAAILDWLNARF